jgi:predicted RNA-binding Zn-ribbon protein involved in translation (DUF1610 family)
MKIHKSITPDRILALIEQRETNLDNPGICTACGEDVDGCEPDARKYECEVCGEKAVYAPEELLIMGFAG